MAHRIDDKPIQDRFAGVTFAFFSDEEIKQLSVQQIMDPVPFNHLNNANPKGLHDKKLGVSPFDHNSACPTCGMKVNQCPGHAGHIELTAPCYNPFMFKDCYKLLKAKCFACNRLRIHPNKIEAFTAALKLVKAGDIVASQQIKAFLLYAAMAIKTVPTSMTHTGSEGPEGNKKLIAFKKEIEKEMKIKINVDAIDLPNFFAKVDNVINERKEEHEQALQEHLQKVAEGTIPFPSTSTQQKAILDLQKEIWAAVVTTICPHCKHKSPAVKKDGYTKIFIKPLAGQAAVTSKQQKTLEKSNFAKEGKSHSERANSCEGFEVVTNASTHGGQALSSRKPSDVTLAGSSTRGDNTVNGDDDDEQNDEESGIDSDEEEEYKEGTPQKYITPIQVKDHLSRLWKNEYAILSLLYGRFDSANEKTHSYSAGVSMFFITKVIVPPTRFRPESQGHGAPGGDNKAFLHTHSAMLTKVLQTNQHLSEALLKDKDYGQTETAAIATPSANPTQKWIMLQDSINIFMDASMAQKTSEKQQQGVRQLLEKKEGMFRMKMMGKRVNFGGRSVISPDPMIRTDQIGVPVFMARKLTFPESVAAINVDRLAKLVRNGSSVWPGANIIQDDKTGDQIVLSNMSAEDRDSLAKQLLVGRKTVHRHLQNGDVLLVNRQPTLHKPSIMAHMARVLPKEQTLRMHYANCSTYNADFDGDEMNIHLPQSYHAASEAIQLMATHKQYVVPTSGKPIRGLIQDSVVSGVFLSSKDQFFDKEDYMQLVYVGLRELLEEGKLQRIRTVKPQIMKPQRLWTGKQVITTILKNIVLSDLSPEQTKQIKKACGLNLDSKSRLSAKEWGPLGKEEGEIIIRNNEHLQGALDKNQFGANDQSMVHCFYEIYGSEKAGTLLTSLARIFVSYLQTHGLTCGLDDLVLKPSFNKIRRRQIEEGHKNGLLTATKFCDMTTFQIQKMNYSNRVVFQSEKNFDKEVQEWTKMALPADPFDSKKKCIQQDNSILARMEEKIGMTLADKDQVEAELDGQMKGTMGQATSKVINSIIPEGLIKRFPKNNISAMVLTGAKGGVVNQTQISALLGQQELEGRRVPRMQNGKTLPCFLAYDPNPRASGYVSDRFISGLRPQDFFFHCMAGREGLIDTAVKTSRSGYLQRCLIKQLESLVVSYDMTVRDNDGSIVQFMYGDDGIDVMDTKFMNKFKFMENNHTLIQSRVKKFLSSGAVEIETVPKAMKQIARDAKRLCKSDKKLTQLEAQHKLSDPIMTILHPQKHFGSISEYMEAQLTNYIAKDSSIQKVAQEAENTPLLRYPVPKDSDFKQMYYWKYLKSMIHSGENVGTIAAQSIGEPSTQLTLNTFHLAGSGVNNVTMGIPRLKEILMTTPHTIKTPSMTIFFNKQAELSQAKMIKIANSYQRLILSDMVSDIHLGQKIHRASDGTYQRLYKITLQFEDAQKLKEKLGIKFKRLAEVFGDKFVPLLMTETLKQVRKSTEMELAGPKKASAHKGDGQGELKKILQKTTKATKVARGTKGGVDGAEENPEAADELPFGSLAAVDASGRSKKKKQAAQDASDNDDSNEDEDDDERTEKETDIDGPKKRKMTNYDNSESEDNGNSDEDAPANEDAQMEEVDFNEQAMDNDELRQTSKDIEQHKRIFKQKHAKYLQYLKGDFEFDENKSATVTLQFPMEYKKLLMFDLAKNVLKRVLVRSIPGIERCQLVPPQKAGQEPTLCVQGISFEAFEKDSDNFDLQRTQTNHSYALIKKYGIEACRTNIVKEIRSVFEVYGIAVDYRHLSLIGDFVTFNGDYRAFNRIGMEESASPFLKMSYETTLKYLVQSCVTNATDWMKSPSSALVLGQLPNVGSNVFELIQDSV